MVGGTGSDQGEQALPNGIVFDRRALLKAMVAAVAVPAVIRNFNELVEEEVAAAWEVAQENPMVFVCDEYRTISLLDFIEPQFRRELYFLEEAYFDTPEGMYEAAEGCEPFRWFLNDQYYEFWELLDRYCRSESGASPIEAARLDSASMIEAVLEWNAAYAWADDPYDEDLGLWLKVIGDAGFSQLRSKALEWWNARPDNSDEWDHFREAADGQAYAYQFFGVLSDPELRESLGIRIVEGDSPGSSYLGAELIVPAEEANAAAVRLGLPFRFRTQTEA